MILESALLCLALNVFHESRGQPDAVQEAVAQVTMTRASHEEKNVCTEVLRPRQFSWANQITNLPKSKQMGLLVKRVPKSTNKGAYKEWLESKAVALRVLNGDKDSKAYGASYFYNVRTDNPGWKKKLKHVARIGPFIFMKPLGYEDCKKCKSTLPVREEVEILPPTTLVATVTSESAVQDDDSARDSIPSHSALEYKATDVQDTLSIKQENLEYLFFHGDSVFPTVPTTYVCNTYFAYLNRYVIGDCTSS